MPKSRILGTGHYLPDRLVTNFDLMKVMDTTNEFIVERTGVEKRHYADPEMATSDLAVRACQAALDDAGLTAGEIDLLIMNTLTPDHFNPGCAFFLQPKLGMQGIPVLDIKQGCAAILYGLSMADHFIAAGTYRHVLITCAEIQSKFADYSNDGRNLSALQADGAGAVVVGPADGDAKGIRSVILHADGDGATALRTEAPGCAAGRTKHLTHEDIDTGRIYDRMNGRVVFENGVEKMSGVMQELLDAHGLTIDDIDRIIPHQPNLRMLEAIIERTGYPPEKFFVNVVEQGNMASATTPIAFDQARRSQFIRDGDLAIIVAFGAGFSWGTALIQM
ncbi:MAG: ketoacyl-ACP synthase III [Planctomycetes bacterium]|nr:ketoacyl-ACP synthase III [Planctomycetota bacterium]